MDYYEVLGIVKTASKQEIKSAYRKLATRYHPDVNDASNATAFFRLINEAYEMLYDDHKRSQYDLSDKANYQSKGSAQNAKHESTNNQPPPKQDSDRNSNDQNSKHNSESWWREEYSTEYREYYEDFEDEKVYTQSEASRSDQVVQNDTKKQTSYPNYKVRRRILLILMLPLKAIVCILWLMVKVLTGIALLVCAFSMMIGSVVAGFGVLGGIILACIAIFGKPNNMMPEVLSAIGTILLGGLLMLLGRWAAIPFFWLSYGLEKIIKYVPYRYK